MRFLICLQMAFPVAVIALTVTKAGIFRGVRNWVGTKDRLWKLYDLISCPFCTGMWVSFAFSGCICYHDPAPSITGNVVFDFMTQTGCILGPAMLLAMVIWKCIYIIAGTEIHDA